MPKGGNRIQPISNSVILFLLIIIVSVSSCYLITAEYEKKQKVSGYLSPSSGLIKIYSPQGYYVTEIYVKEGASVNKGDPIFKLERSKSFSLDSDTNKLLADGLSKQINLMEDRKISINELKEEKERELIERLGNIIKIINLKKEKIKQIELRKSIIYSRLKNYNKMSKNGHMSIIENEKQKNMLLKINEDLIQEKSDLVKYIDEKQNISNKIKRIPIDIKKEIQQINIEISEKRNQLYRIKSEQTQVILASKKGKIAAISVELGQKMKGQQYMATLIPESEELNAILFIPTRSFGFVDVGQESRLKMDAFPYQKFGSIVAEIIETEKSVILPNEHNYPVNFSEPMYRVEARLKEQSIYAYGKKIPLKVGMTLNADVIVDKRSLGEWLLEPFLALR